MSYSEYIEAHPQGVQWTYAFKMTGLPYLWDDGKAPWSRSDGFFPDVDEGIDTVHTSTSAWQAQSNDIEVHIPSVRMTQFRYKANLTTTTQMRLYYRPGTCMGFTSSSAGWTLIFDGNVATTAGENKKVDLPSPIDLSTGLHGFYLTSVAAVSPIRYIAGAHQETDNGNVSVWTRQVNSRNFGTSFDNYRCEFGINYTILGAERLYTVKPGGLAETNFDLTASCNPMEPLSTGGGLRVKLLDDDTGYLREMFAPLHGTTSRLAEKVTRAASTIEIATDEFSEGDYLYLGSSETVHVSGKSTTTLTVDRGMFDSLALVHNPADSSSSGPIISDSPRTFKGRWGEIIASPVNALTGLRENEEFVVWAGYVNAVRNDTFSYDVELVPLTDVMKTKWPNRLAAGTFTTMAKDSAGDPVFGSWTDAVNLTMEDYILRFNIDSTPYIVNVGGLDSSGVFSIQTPSNQTITLHTYLQWLSATITNYLATNKVFIGLDYMSDASIKLYYKNTSAQRVSLDLTYGFARKLAALFPYNAGFVFEASTPEYTTLASITWEVAFGSASITKTDRTFDVYVDDPVTPFIVSGPTSGVNRGFAKIENGSTIELISFGSVTIDENFPRRMKLDDVRRGILGTASQDYTMEEAAGTRITQLCMYGANNINGVVAPFIPPYALLSAGGNSSNSAFDLLYQEFGLAVPERYVNWESFVGLNDVDVPQIQGFWVSEPGKGGEDLAELMKTAGLFFVTKRFERNGQHLYGIAVDSITMPTQTAYMEELGDSHRSVGSRVLVDYNERLLVNVVKLKPELKRGRIDNYYQYAEGSIADYGVAETLEIEPSAVLGRSRAGANASGWSTDLYISETLIIALRWFAAFSQGNYTITITTGHIGRKYQVGDRVKLSLVGVDSIDGLDGITNTIGKIIEVKNNHGTGSSSIKVRIAYKQISELVPAVRVTAASGTTLTLEPFTYTGPGAPTPFGQAGTAKDIYWFDREEFDANIPVRIWAEGQPDTAIERTVIASNLDGGTVTINSAFPGSGDLFDALAAGDNIIMTYDDLALMTGILPGELFTYIDGGMEWV